jgi:hypothetical protein
MSNGKLEIIQFSNETAEGRKLLKPFLKFHWTHYKNVSQFIPLLDYEYLGFKLFGLTGWLEKTHVFFKHAEANFFLVKRDGKIVGRTDAFVNHHHNEHAKDKVGFFGLYESVNDPEVNNALLDKAVEYLKSKGMTAMRGPQNFPVNEATPGIMIEGFNSKPYVYYHYNFPYYAELLSGYGMKAVKKVVGMDVPVQTPVQERLLRVTELTKKRHKITLESFTNRRYKVLREQMFDIYNDAWKDNWGFVPMTREEFYHNLHSVKMVWDPKMFHFAYVDGEPAAFFGSVPNVLEVLKPIPGFQWCELLRGGKMLLLNKRIKSFRQGYFGIKPKFRKIGLDAVLISEAKHYTQTHGYTACDIGWVLEDNDLVIRMADFMGGKLSRTYAIYEKDIV